MEERLSIGYTGEDSLEEYISGHIEPEPELLYRLYRSTNIKLLNPRMASGHIQGRLLKMLTRMINPGSVLEIGTYTAYSTLCMAEGLQEGAVIHTVEVNDELETFIREWTARSRYGKNIKLHIGNALKVVPGLGVKFDMIFMDADKREYPAYYDLLMDYLNPGGYLLADNTLWDGHVIDPKYGSDPQTMGVKRFNEKVARDKRVETVIVPFRDGLSIIRKRE